MAACTPGVGACGRQGAAAAVVGLARSPRHLPSAAPPSALQPGGRSSLWSQILCSPTLLPLLWLAVRRCGGRCSWRGPGSSQQALQRPAAAVQQRAPHCRSRPSHRSSVASASQTWLCAYGGLTSRSWQPCQRQRRRRGAARRGRWWCWGLGLTAAPGAWRCRQECAGMKLTSQRWWKP